MTRTRIVVLSAGTFIAGVISGGLVVGWFTSQFLLAPSLVNSAALAAMVETVALQSLRAGDGAKAASTLELSLDGNLLTLSALLEHQSDESVRRILQAVAEYRAKNPRASTEQVGGAEMSALLSKYRNTGEGKK